MFHDYLPSLLLPSPDGARIHCGHTVVTKLDANRHDTRETLTNIPARLTVLREPRFHAGLPPPMLLLTVERSSFIDAAEVSTPRNRIIGIFEDISVTVPLPRFKFIDIYRD